MRCCAADPPRRPALPTALLVGLLARELGGDRWAQPLAATLWATSGVSLVSGHLLSTTSESHGPGSGRGYAGSAEDRP